MPKTQAFLGLAFLLGGVALGCEEADQKLPDGGLSHCPRKKPSASTPCTTTETCYYLPKTLEVQFGDIEGVHYVCHCDASGWRCSKDDIDE